jgi:hypothetical protein
VRERGRVTEAGTLVSGEGNVRSGVASQIQKHANNRGIGPVLLGRLTMMVSAQRLPFSRAWGLFWRAVHQTGCLNNLVHESSLSMFIMLGRLVVLDVNAQECTDGANHDMLLVVFIAIVLEALNEGIHDDLVTISV